MDEIRQVRQLASFHKLKMLAMVLDVGDELWVYFWWMLSMIGHVDRQVQWHPFEKNLLSE